jgi:hypothetical protein
LAKREILAGTSAPAHSAVATLGFIFINTINLVDLINDVARW